MQIMVGEGNALDPDYVPQVCDNGTHKYRQVWKSTYAETETVHILVNQWERFKPAIQEGIGKGLHKKGWGRNQLSIPRT